MDANALSREYFALFAELERCQLSKEGFRLAAEGAENSVLHEEASATHALYEQTASKIRTRQSRVQDRIVTLALEFKGECSVIDSILEEREEEECLTTGQEVELLAALRRACRLNSPSIRSLIGAEDHYRFEKQQDEEEGVNILVVGEKNID